MQSRGGNNIRRNPQVFLRLLNLNLNLSRHVKTALHSAEFPYLSPCGRERNYVRCDDVPIVYTNFLGVEGGVDELQSMQREEQQLTPVTLSWGGAGDQLTTVFEPWRICMLPSTGRVYHPTTSTTTTLDATASTAPSPTSSPLSRPGKSSTREVGHVQELQFT